MEGFFGKFRFGSLMKQMCPHVLALWACVGTISGETAIEIYGTYEGSIIDLATGRVRPQVMRSGEFHVILCDRKYWLSVTSGLGSVWVEVVYDGTNNYYISQHLVPRNGDIVVDEKFPVRVEISSRPNGMWLSGYMDFSYQWLMYCLSPEAVPPEEKFIITTRLVGSRMQLSGWKYEAQWCKCGNHVARLRTVRDTSLDLDFKQELAHPDMVWSPHIEVWNSIVRRFERRRRIPNGYVSLEYECREWLLTNGICIPVAGTFRERYPAESDGSRTVREEVVEVKAVSVLVRSNVPPFVPKLTVPAIVIDFRYRRMQDDRIFYYAGYTLKPGEGFRGTNDPELLAKAERALRCGRKYYEPPVSGKHKVLWVVAVLLAVPPVVYLLYRWRSGGSVRG